MIRNMAKKATKAVKATHATAIAEMAPADKSSSEKKLKLLAVERRGHFRGVLLYGAYLGLGLQKARQGWGLGRVPLSWQNIGVVDNGALSPFETNQGYTWNCCSCGEVGRGLNRGVLDEVEVDLEVKIRVLLNHSKSKVILQS